MLYLFFRACFLFVIHAVHSATYAAVALLFLLNAAALFALDKNYELVTLFFTLFILTNTLYLYAATRQMRKDNPTIAYRANMRWSSKHNEMLFFVISGSMLFAALAFYVSDFMFTLREIANDIEKEVKQRGDDPFSVLVGVPHLLIVGSRLLSLFLLLLSLWLWNFFCRIGIRIPALTDGYYLRINEAMELTHQNTFAVTTVSLFFIVSVSALASTVIGKIPTPPPHPWILPLVYTVAYFVLAQLHIGLWVALYEKVTVNYKMNRLQK